MAVIPNPKECMIRKSNQKLFDDLWELFDYWDIGLWEETSTSVLAEIWCETIREFSPSRYSEETVKKKFIDKIMERMVNIL